MASIKISNLPPISPGTLTDDDQFVLNDANQTTSRLSYGNLKTRFLGENHTFTGSVNFTGDVNVNVNSTNTNVLTIESATILIDESEARSAALIQANTDDITRLVSLTKAPSTGGIYPGTTFAGAANGATNLVDALNAVATESDATKTELATVENLVNQNGTNIGTLQSITSDHGTRITALEETVDGDGVNPGLEARIAANEVAIAALDAQLNDTTTGIVDVIGALDARVVTIETSLTAGEGGIKDEVDANTVLAQQGVDDAAAAATAVSDQRSDVRAALASISSGLDTFGTNNQAATGNDVIAELVRLINIELAAGGNLEG